MAGGGRRALERIWRGIRTAYFVVAMVASLFAQSAPVLVAATDEAVSLALASAFACARCFGVREHLERYSFRSSLMDIPLVSLARSLVIACVYLVCDGPGMFHGTYLGTAALCSSVSLIILSVKACVFAPILEFEPAASSPLVNQKLHLQKSWGMPVMFVSSLVFALGHVVVAYKTSCRARRKLLFHHMDPESVLSCKNVFSGYNKVPRSPTPCVGKGSKSFRETNRKAMFHDESYLPISLLADIDSSFVACQGLTVHYKLCVPESPQSSCLASLPFSEPISVCSPRSISPERLKYERASTVPPNTFHLSSSRSLSNQFHDSSLYVPLLEHSVAPPTFMDEVHALSMDDGDNARGLTSTMNLNVDLNVEEKFAIVLVHGFGGGVFSWRHVMNVLARQIGCTVVAFDRPGWGLTSRPRTKDWEAKQLSNPYRLESQVDLLISFCLDMGFSSVVLVGHDDGGLLALKTAEKIRASSESRHVAIRGVVLLSVSLSREVIPAFARILLHTSLGKKHMVRPLLRAEITQVINRHAWYDASKLTTEVLNLYKAPLFVEGWDEALHEIGRFSFATVLSPQDTATLLKSVEDLPVLIVAGAEDALVSIKSAQAMASKIANSRLVAISGCGHLPHEECPKALLAALFPFITKLLPPPDALQKH